MKEEQDEYHPYYEMTFNFTTSIIKDDAILAMLGWEWRFKHFNEFSSEEWDYEHRLTQYDLENIEASEPGLNDILYGLKRKVDREYTKAKRDPPEDEDAIANKKEDIKKCHALIATAYRFNCEIDDELAKGENSMLRIDQCATKNEEYPFITIISLAEWADSKYKITLFPTPFPASEITTFNDLNQSQKEIEDSLEKSLSPEGAKQFHITHALLVEEVAGKIPSCMREDGTVNIKQLIKMLNIDTKIYFGQSKSTLSELYPKILSLKNGTDTEKLEPLSSTILRNQRINLAFLVEEFYKLDNPGCDTANIDEETVGEIAKHLAGLGKGLPGQSQKLIESRIKEAIDVKNDPNSIKA